MRMARNDTRPVCSCRPSTPGLGSARGGCPGVVQGGRWLGGVEAADEHPGVVPATVDTDLQPQDEVAKALRGVGEQTDVVAGLGGQDLLTGNQLEVPRAGLGPVGEAGLA